MSFFTTFLKQNPQEQKYKEPKDCVYFLCSRLKLAYLANNLCADSTSNQVLFSKPQSTSFAHYFSLWKKKTWRTISFFSFIALKPVLDTNFDYSLKDMI